MRCAFACSGHWTKARRLATVPMAWRLFIQRRRDGASREKERFGLASFRGEELLGSFKLPLLGIYLVFAIFPRNFGGISWYFLFLLESCK
jgi:hypothetical protein